MTDEDWHAREDRRQAELKAYHQEHQKKRAAKRERLFGSADEFDRQAPAPIADFDALLAEHAAQLRNAVRQTMEFALWEDAGAKDNALSASALTRLIQTNIAIAKVLGAREISKTVRGGAKPKKPQD